MKIILFLFLTTTFSLQSFSQLTAKQIIEKSDAIMKGVKTTKAEMTITTVRPRWSREMTLKMWAKGSELSMVYILSPAKDKGTTYLMRDREVWNWVPSIERSIKLPPSMMMQSWMGTDFTNDDLVKQSSIVTDYDHELLGEVELDGRTCYKLKLVPKKDAPVVWGKVLVWTDKEDFFQLRVEYFDDDGYKINIMKASEVKMLGGRKMPTVLEMIPVEKKGQKTIMKYNSIEFDSPIEDGFFSVQNMKRLKP